MITHCANPACAIPLHRLRDGRLFQFDVKSALPATVGREHMERRKVTRNTAHFWLCGQCSESMTLIFDQLQGVKVIPLMEASARKATTAF
jgi:hypothetical protein